MVGNISLRSKKQRKEAWGCVTEKGRGAKIVLLKAEDEVCSDIHNLTGHVQECAPLPHMHTCMHAQEAYAYTYIGRHTYLLHICPHHQDS